MSTFKNPVGPQPSRVYWRRRLVVGLGLFAIFIIVFLIIVGPGSGKPAATQTPGGSTSSGTPTSGATQTGSADGAVACDPSKVTLEAVTDLVSYDPGVAPLLTFTLKSTMTVPCTIEAGSDVQEYRITSGDELIWSSKDCQSSPVAAEALLLPGVPQSPASIPWDRSRSSVGTCDQANAEVTAGGASYHLNVIVGELKSAESKQFLLY